MARTEVSSAAVLEQVPLLADLTKRDRSRLVKSMRERTFPAGKQVVVEGKGGVGFFVILEGQAAVSIGGDVVRVLGPGDHFGEMALLVGTARSATVTADSDLRCLSVTSWDFKSFVLEHPTVGWALLETLAQRLLETSVR